MRVAVSGGLSGLGAAIVSEGCARGWSMSAASRRTGLDVCDENSIDRFLAPGIDAAVNCAGVSIDNLLATSSPQEVSQVLHINLDGAFLFARAAIRHGALSILFIGSLHQLGAPGNAVYAASKAALAGLMAALCGEYPEVRVNLLVPGFVITPMSESLPPAVQERLCSASPLGRAVCPQEVARCATDILLSPLRGRVVRVTAGLLETPL